MKQHVDLWQTLAVLVAVLCWLLPSAPVRAEDDEADAVTVIHAGHLIDPATGEVADGQRILVDAGGEITAVGAGVEVPDDAMEIDLSGSWVMPGLMDAHTHLTWNQPATNSGGNWIHMLVREGTGLRALRGIHNARIVLEAGFTTVKDIGNAANYADTDMRVAIERGWFNGPTIVNAGKIIAPFGGQMSGISPETGPLWQFEYIDADTPDEVRKAVRRNIYYGAQVIKLVTDSAKYFYSEEEVRAAVEEARRAGLAVTVHAVRDEPARNVILAGAAGIEHGFRLSDDVLELMKEKGTVLVGTDFPEEHWKAIFGKNSIDLLKAFHDRLKRAHEIGVVMAFGSDTIADLPGKTRADMMLDYLDVWIGAGIPPAKVLRSWTTEVARLLEIDDERGAVAEGQMADIIAMPENPLADVQALRGVHFVMKNGRVVRHDPLKK